MRALLLYCALALFCGGRLCLANTVRDRLHVNDPLALTRDRQQLNQRRQQRQFSVEGGAESPKETAQTDEAKGIVDNFIDKIKRNENVNAEPQASQCGYEVKTILIFTT